MKQKKTTDVSLVGNVNIAMKPPETVKIMIAMKKSLKMSR